MIDIYVPVMMDDGFVEVRVLMRADLLEDDKAMKMIREICRKKVEFDREKDGGWR